MTSKQIKNLAAFVESQRRFVSDMAGRKFEAVPSLQAGHNRDLAEAKVVLSKAEELLERALLSQVPPGKGAAER
jgi:hypothetical protein